MYRKFSSLDWLSSSVSNSYHIAIITFSAVVKYLKDGEEAQQNYEVKMLTCTPYKPLGGVVWLKYKKSSSNKDHLINQSKLIISLYFAFSSSKKVQIIFNFLH